MKKTIYICFPSGGNVVHNASYGGICCIERKYENKRQYSSGENKL